MNKLISLDSDGVMLDYIAAYVDCWEKVFGEKPKLKNPDAYWAVDRYEIKHLSEKELKHFKSHMQHEFWENVPALPGAVQACNALVKAGYTVVSVSALPLEYAEARLKGLKKHGFKISKVYGVDKEIDHTSQENVKEKILNNLKPLVHADDFVTYFKGVDNSIHKALISRNHNSLSPNFSHNESVHSTHDDLQCFSDYWLNKHGKN